MKRYHPGQSERLPVAAPSYLAGHNVIRMANVAGRDTIALIWTDAKAYAFSV